MDELSEIEKVKITAVENRFWYPKRLILEALDNGVFMNLNKQKPYSYARIYAMLREGQEWVTEKLVKFAKENPKE